MYHVLGFDLEDLHHSSVFMRKRLKLFPFTYEGPGSYFLWRAVFVKHQKTTEAEICRCDGGRWCCIGDCFFSKKLLGCFANAKENNKTFKLAAWN